MKKKCDKALRRAYRKGRKDGFDHGFAVANAVHAEITAELIKDIEALNSELILGIEEEDEDGDTY